MTKDYASFYCYLVWKGHNLKWLNGKLSDDDSQEIGFGSSYGPDTVNVVVSTTAGTGIPPRKKSKKLIEQDFQTEVVGALVNVSRSLNTINSTPSDISVDHRSLDNTMEAEKLCDILSKHHSLFSDEQKDKLKARLEDLLGLN